MENRTLGVKIPQAVRAVMDASLSSLPLATEMM